MIGHAVPPSRLLLVVLIGACTGLATLAGGALALRLRGQVRSILGFSAGAVIAVALYDLLPEALQLAGPAHAPRQVFTVLLVAFALYMFAERALQGRGGEGQGHAGHLGPASLTAHSFLDGLGIGLAFQVSTPVGLVLALAVLAHDFSDGINTVNLSLLGGRGPRAARAWLIADAAAPIAGVIAGHFISLDAGVLGLLLAAFAGMFLYIGAAELLPDSHDRHPHLRTSLATALGMLVIWAAIRLAPG